MRQTIASIGCALLVLIAARGLVSMQGLAGGTALFRATFVLIGALFMIEGRWAMADGDRSRGMLQAAGGALIFGIAAVALLLAF